MYMFSKLYEFPPKLGSKTEDIFTFFFFFPPVTDEETKHKEKFVFAHESRCDQLSQFFLRGRRFPGSGTFKCLHWESTRQTGMSWSPRHRKQTGT